jgi:hypothetical protein
VQLGRDAAAVGIVLGGSETLAQNRYFMLAGAAPTNLRTAAGCGHIVSPELFYLANRSAGNNTTDSNWKMHFPESGEQNSAL